MLDETTEFEIAQYADGTLPDERRPFIEALLAADPQARRQLQDEHALDSLLKNRAPAPGIAWQRLQNQINGVIDESDASAPSAAAERRALLEPIRTPWRLRHWLTPVGLAAALLVALSVVWQMARAPTPAIGPAPSGALFVQGPVIQPGAGPAIVEIAIGPSLDRGHGDGVWRHLQDAAAPRLVIASQGQDGQDDPLAY